MCPLRCDEDGTVGSTRKGEKMMGKEKAKWK